MSYTAMSVRPVGYIVPASEWNLIGSNFADHETRLLTLEAAGGLAGIGFERVEASVAANGGSFQSLTGGPSVTVDIGASGEALVILTASISREANSPGGAVMGYRVDGGSDVDFVIQSIVPRQAPDPETGMAMLPSIGMHMATGLSEDSHTFETRYKSTTSGDANFSRRAMTVIPLG